MFPVRLFFSALIPFGFSNLADMTKILELEPSHDQARRTVMRLKPLADEKREKMKEEMIGKLNSLLSLHRLILYFLFYCNSVK